MISDPARLELVYSYEAAAYWFAERRCHDEIGPRRGRQRDITRWSFEVVRGARDDVQPFTGLLLQFPQAGTAEPGQVAPDSAVFVHPEQLEPGDHFSTPLHPARPLLVADYRHRKDIADYERELSVPYFLYHPDADEFTLFRLGEKGYSSVPPNASGRCPIPELELEVGLLGKWMRYWFRGELLPLPGDLLKERDAARQRLDAERQARQAAEAELAQLRAELARAKDS